MDRFYVASTLKIAGDFTHGRGHTAASTGPPGLPQGPAEPPVPCRPAPTPRPVAAAGARTRPLGPIRARRGPTYRPAEEAASGPCAGVNDGAKKGHVAEHEWAIEPAGPLSWRFLQLYPQVRTLRKGAPSVSS